MTRLRTLQRTSGQVARMNKGLHCRSAWPIFWSWAATLRVPRELPYTHSATSLRSWRKSSYRMKSTALYEFGRFRFDPANHLLLSEGTPVSLTPKSFEFLLVLVQNGTNLTTKEELMQKVWPDSFVEEANLTVNISALRKLLGETTEGQPYIETVPKKGYRF